jgi:hypothetical protein
MLDSRMVSDNVSGLVKRQNVEMPEVARQRVGACQERVGPNGRMQFWTRLLASMIALGVSVGPDSDLTLMDVVGVRWAAWWVHAYHVATMMGMR